LKLAFGIALAFAYEAKKERDECMNYGQYDTQRMEERIETAARDGQRLERRLRDGAAVG
jgi:hypothetical protein